MTKAAGVIVLALALMPFLLAQAPSRDAEARQAKPATGRLSGRVTTLDTGRPIRRALVSASGPEIGGDRSIWTDAEGRWEIDELPAGRVTLMVTKGGFVGLTHGQRRPFDPGKPIDLSHGQSIGNIDFAMPRASVITGRVVDEFGEPVTGVSVGATRQMFKQGVRRLIEVGQSDTSNDIGHFRLHGLPPGDYYLLARPAFTRFLNSTDDRIGYTTTYYPGTPDISQAVLVRLALGQESQNIVIPLTPVRLTTISGIATDSNGAPAAGATLFLQRSAGSLAPAKSGTTRSDGSWTLSGVIPGSYELWLHIRSNSPEVGPSGRSGMVAEVSRERITVDGADIKGVHMVTAPLGSVRGRVRFRGAPSVPAGEDWAVIGVDMDSSVGEAGGAAVVKPDGSFEMPLFGRTILRMSGSTGGITKGWMLESIMFEGADITDTGVDVAPGQELSGIEVTLTQRTTEVRGTVESTDGAQVHDYVVVIFAANAERWGPQTRFVGVGRPTQTGEFTVAGLPPASYFAVALEYLEIGEETNPELLARLKDLGTSIRLDEGEKKALALKISSQ